MSIARRKPNVVISLAAHTVEAVRLADAFELQGANRERMRIAGWLDREAMTFKPGNVTRGVLHQLARKLRRDGVG